MSNTQGPRRGSVDETIAPRDESRAAGVDATIAPAAISSDAQAKPAPDVTIASSKTARHASDETVAPADTSRQLLATIDCPATPAGFNATIDSIPSTPAAGKAGAAGTPRPQVEGYTILSELGRGGMGVVYKARQQKLNRIVALKMVLAGAHAGADQLARFYTEAEAVAHLQQPHIVQIHEVGEHAGLPYFSLEYVDGGSLSEQIDGKPQPVEDAGRMVELLARAMAYAHGQGIVHRDLKPANVLITREGEPKITDFGLAKRLESDSSQTKSGTLMGTPNYMAPEQAKGLVHEIGPLADVYALGVILYEMLTGRTPFLGTSILDTLQQVRNLEPVPPSRLQPKVPRDLETICLKCLQKEPVKRYESAAGLADDLHRFLAGEPILARPVVLPERCWRWCQRNPRIAALSAAVLLLLVSLAVGGPVAAILVSQQKALAVKNEQAARVAQTAAEQAQELAEQRKEEAERARLVADENAKVAGEQAGLALTTIQTLIDKVQKQLQDAPQTQQLKKDLLQTAMDGLKQVSQRAEGSTTIEATMANAHMKMGLIFRQLGETEEAFKQFMRCHEITQRRAAAKPESDAAKSNVAATLTVLGDMSQDLRRDMEGALQYYLQAMTLREELYREPRGGEGKVEPVAVTKALAETYSKVGLVLLRLGDAERTLRYYESSLKLRQELAAATPGDAATQQNLARSFGAIGDVSFRLKKLDLAREHHTQALEVREGLYQASPNNRLKQEMAGSHGMLGEIALRSGDFSVAQPSYDRSLALCQELLESDPKNVNYQRDLGIAYYRAGTLAQRLGDAEQAKGHFQACLALREQMAAADPMNDRRRMELIVVLPHCGQHQRAAEMADRQRASATADSELLMEMACCYAQCAAAATSDAALRQVYADKAIAAIQDAAAQGYKDVVVLETDPDLAPIRHEAGYLALVETLKQAGSAAAPLSSQPERSN
jgi:eukaryotic-like serine/threonine-protein kinase